MIKLKNISKTYETVKDKPVSALSDVNLSFASKGMVFVLGKSGSGKSTLLNIIGGLDKYDNGEMFVKGKSTINFKPIDFDFYRNTSVGFIFQEYNLLEDLTVYENIELAMELQGKNYNKDFINEILKDVVKILFTEATTIAIINFIIALLISAISILFINIYLKNDYGLIISIVSFGFRQIFIMLIISLLVAYLSSTIPVRRIANKNPIDAIRNK